MKYVAYACDEKYSRLLAVSLASLLKNNDDNESFHFFIFDCGLSESSRDIIDDVVTKTNNLLTWIMTENLFSKMWIVTSVYTKAIYARLFIDILPDNIHRLLYLDCDTIIKSSISALFDVDMKENKIILGKRETTAFCHERELELKQYFYGNYINTGVLIIDVDVWKNMKFSHKIRNYLNDHQILSFPDQDALNVVCRDFIDGTLEYKYNAQFVKGGGGENIIILHYGGYAARANLPSFRNLYRPYLEETKWKYESELVKCSYKRRIKDRIWTILQGNFLPFGNKIYNMIIKIGKIIKRRKRVNGWI